MFYNGAQAQEAAEESPCKVQAGEGAQGLSKGLLWVPAENPVSCKGTRLSHSNNPLQLPALPPYFWKASFKWVVFPET